MIKTINPRKAAVIGCGFVGAATAFTLMQSRLFTEMVLLDANYDKADGEAKDISHGVPFAGQMKIYAGGYVLSSTLGAPDLSDIRQIK